MKIELYIYIGKKGVPNPTYLWVDGLAIIFVTMEEVNTLGIIATSENYSAVHIKWKTGIWQCYLYG